MSDTASEMHNLLILNAHIDALKAELAALTAKLERVRSLVIEMGRQADCKARMDLYIDDILREVGRE